MMSYLEITKNRNNSGSNELCTTMTPRQTKQIKLQFEEIRKTVFIMRYRYISIT